MSDGDQDVDPVSVVADAQRLVGPDVVDETHVVTLGGVPQVVSLRGRRRDSPVLVVVHGGPVSHVGIGVHHDQRAAGRSYRLSTEDQVRSTLAVETYVEDLVELLGWVTRTLGVERVALLGHSWGGVLAVRAAHVRPDLVSVYLGVGQAVSMLDAERVSWAWAREEATRRGDAESVDTLDETCTLAWRTPGRHGVGTAHDAAWGGWR